MVLVQSIPGETDLALKKAYEEAVLSLILEFTGKEPFTPSTTTIDK